MADINVERKGPSIWPWIIGLIILALVIWALAELMGDDDVVDTDPVAVVDEPAASPVPAPVTNTRADSMAGPAVQEYLAMCTGTAAEVAPDHQFTSGCLDQLATTLESVVQRPDMAGLDLQAQLTDFRQKADRLVQSPNESTQHANWTREAFISAADLLDDLQDDRYPELEAGVERLTDAAEAVQADALLTEQGDAIHAFFNQVGDLLSAMGTAPTA